MSNNSEELGDWYNDASGCAASGHPCYVISTMPTVESQPLRTDSPICRLDCGRALLGCLLLAHCRSTPTIRRASHETYLHRAGLLVAVHQHNISDTPLATSAPGPCPSRASLEPRHPTALHLRQYSTVRCASYNRQSSQGVARLCGYSRGRWCRILRDCVKSWRLDIEDDHSPTKPSVGARHPHSRRLTHRSNLQAHHPCRYRDPALALVLHCFRLRTSTVESSGRPRIL